MPVLRKREKPSNTFADDPQTAFPTHSISAMSSFRAFSMLENALELQQRTLRGEKDLTQSLVCSGTRCPLIITRENQRNLDVLEELGQVGKRESIMCSCCITSRSTTRNHGGILYSEKRLPSMVQPPPPLLPCQFCHSRELHILQFPAQ